MIPGDLNPDFVSEDVCRELRWLGEQAENWLRWAGEINAKAPERVPADFIEAAEAVSVHAKVAERAHRELEAALGQARATIQEAAAA